VKREGGVQLLAFGHIRTYRRVPSSASWSAMQLACGITRLVLPLVPADRPVSLVGDDTVEMVMLLDQPLSSSSGAAAWRGRARPV
jgi:hypothetical protein